MTTNGAAFHSGNYSGRDVVDALLDIRAELIELRAPSRAINAVDRRLARAAKPPPPTPAPAPIADRDELQRVARLLLDLRDGAVVNGHTRDAAALLRVAKFVAAERRAAP